MGIVLKTWARDILFHFLNLTGNKNTNEEESREFLFTAGSLFSGHFFNEMADEVSGSCWLYRWALHESHRFGGEERRLMHLVPAPAVRLMKSRVLSRPGVNSLVQKKKKKKKKSTFFPGNAELQSVHTP